MHIEPGVVNGAKIGLSFLTSAAAIALGLKLLIQQMFNNTSVLVTAVRCLITTIFVFSFFEVLPQYPLGVSEVHFIFGATLFLFFGAGATAFGLVAGLSLFGCRFIFAGNFVSSIRFTAALHKHINSTISFICGFVHFNEDNTGQHFVY